MTIKWMSLAKAIIIRCESKSVGHFLGRQTITLIATVYIHIYRVM